MDKLCPKCGKQLRPDQGFCEACGSAWTPSEAAKPPATRSGSNKGALIVAIVLVVALGIGGWLFLTHRTAAASPVVSSTASSSSSTSVTRSTAPPTPAPVASDTAPLAPMASASGELPYALDAASEAAAKSKPCSVVTPAEMEKILGTRIIKVSLNDTTCLYYTDETRSAEVETTWTGGKPVYLQMKGYNSAPGNVQAIVGIGDEAYFPVTDVLHVLKGDTYVVVNARVYANPLETASAIARKVMEKLK
jgi:hypothetical protein